MLTNAVQNMLKLSLKSVFHQKHLFGLSSFHEIKRLQQISDMIYCHNDLSHRWLTESHNKWGDKVSRVAKGGFIWLTQSSITLTNTRSILVLNFIKDAAQTAFADKLFHSAITLSPKKHLQTSKWLLCLYIKKSWPMCRSCTKTWKTLELDTTALNPVIRPKLTVARFTSTLRHSYDLHWRWPGSPQHWDTPMISTDGGQVHLNIVTHLWSPLTVARFTSTLRHSYDLHWWWPGSPEHWDTPMISTDGGQVHLNIETLPWSPLNLSDTKPMPSKHMTSLRTSTQSDLKLIDRGHIAHEGKNLDSSLLGGEQLVYWLECRFWYKRWKSNPQHHYVFSLSKRLNRHCFSRLSCEMSTRWGQPREGCSVLWALWRNST